MSSFEALALVATLACLAPIIQKSVGRELRSPQSDSGASLTHNKAIMYVSSSGSDSNNGLSWGTAKRTIYGALEALPGGAEAPPTAGSGTVYLSDGASANPIANAGIWLMNIGDPRYAAPPKGWLRLATVNPIAVVGVGCQHSAANHAGGTVCVVHAGGSNDPYHPAVQLEGGAPLKFENLGFFNVGKCLALGIDSTGNRSNSGLVNSSFENVSCGQNLISGNGPDIDIGNNVFNLYFNHISAQGNANNIAPVGPTGYSRTDNVLTVTPSAPSQFKSGQKCGIIGAADASFNGSFGGITVISKRSFTVHQIGPNGISGGGGVVCDNALPMVIDPGTGSGSGLIWVQNSEFNGGGIRFWQGVNGGSLYVENFYIESYVSAPVWIGTSSLYSFVSVRNIQAADPWFPWSAGYLVVNDGQSQSAGVLSNAHIPSVFVESSSNYGACCYGPMNVISDNYYAASANPLVQGQRGLMNGYLRAQTDVARSSPQSVRFVNYAPTNPAAWSLATGTKATLQRGITDRDGGNQAAEGSQTSGGQNYIQFTGGGTHLDGGINVGDWIICAAWVRSLGSFTPYVGAGYAGNQPIQCGPIDGIVTFQYNQAQYGPNWGDGEWEWVWNAYKVSSSSNPSGEIVRFNVVFDTTHPTQAYSPILIHIPAGTTSDGEVMNYLMNLRGYLNTCTPGMLCDTAGQVPRVNARQTWTATQAFGTLSINGEMVSASPRSVQSIFLPGPLTSTWTASTWTPDRAVTITRIQVEAKTAPSECQENAVVRVTDGKHSVNVTISGTANDSGAILQNYAAGTPLTLSVHIGASGCVKAPADANVTLQYKMQ